jgi:hypothetical protein
MARILPQVIVPPVIVHQGRPVPVVFSRLPPLRQYHHF